MSSSYREGVLAHKYAEIPEENKAKGRKKKQRPKKATHKHVYRNCIIVSKENPLVAHLGDHEPWKQSSWAYLVGYCPECGKIKEFVHDDFYDELVKKYSDLYGLYNPYGFCVDHLNDQEYEYRGQYELYRELLDHYSAEGQVFYAKEYNPFETKFLDALKEVKE